MRALLAMLLVLAASTSACLGGPASQAYAEAHLGSIDDVAARVGNTTYAVELDGPGQALVHKALVDLYDTRGPVRTAVDGQPADLLAESQWLRLSVAPGNGLTVPRADHAPGGTIHTVYLVWDPAQGLPGNVLLVGDEVSPGYETPASLAELRDLTVEALHTQGQRAQG